jgi:seryl-tRNA synthetase
VLERQLIRTQPDLVREGARRKGIQAPIDELLHLDTEFRSLKSELDNQRAEQNRISKSIGQLMGAGKKDEAEAAKASVGTLKDAIAAGEAREREMEAQMQELELRIPNLPHVTAPDGKNGDENVYVREWGEKPVFADEPKAHWDVAEELGLLDLARASKISGSGFALYTGWGARLQRALINYMIDHQTLRNGYKEVYPPFAVNSASLFGTGQLPKFEEDLYKVDDDLYLIPTAEVPVTNIYRDEILNGEDLTMKMAAFSGCFRKEAGAAGKDTRGIQRMHQFDKVEMVKLTKPEDSYDELESLTADAESVLQSLGLHYRVMLICTGDMSFSNSKQYDLEVWAPGVGKYLEISSCSNFEAFQARRANIRFRRAQGEKPEFVHILNGSGLATPRLFAAILESCREPDGSLLIPEPLRHYVGTDRITR